GSSTCPKTGGGAVPGSPRRGAYPGAGHGTVPAPWWVPGGLPPGTYHGHRLVYAKRQCLRLILLRCRTARHPANRIIKVPFAGLTHLLPIVTMDLSDPYSQKTEPRRG